MTRPSQPGPDGAPGTFTIEQRPNCIVAPMAGDVTEPDPCAPACAANFDGSGGVGVADLFAFFDAWFAQFPGGLPGEPNADFDRSGAVTVADLFGFLDAWFAEFGTCGV
ncbi:MAG TPA: hypothetical protein PL072_02575 [Phycisphaerales bacterium]|nr:hypothetical protein [Phycisphaerales bacterium]